MTHIIRPPIERFTPKYIIDPITACWEWQAVKNRHGYGLFYYNSQLGKISAHRASYMMFINPTIPQDIICCHICDNPGCVNPYHIFLGTKQDNSDDMVKKGRSHSRPGQQHHFALFTDDVVIDIRFKYSTTSDPNFMKNLASQLNVNYEVIWRICTNKTWTHLL